MWKHAQSLLRIIAALGVAFTWPIISMFAAPLPVVASASLEADVTVTYVITGAMGSPSGFTLTDLGAVSISMNWTSGNNTTYTMIRGSRIDYPATVTSGELVYYGPLTSYNATGYSLDITAYYFSAWAYDSDNTTYAASYATASIGGEGVTELATSVDGLSSTFDNFLVVAQLLAGSIFVLGMFGIALWYSRKGELGSVILMIISALITFFIGITWVDDYSGVSIAMMGLALFEFLQAVITALSLGGASRGISQFKGVINSIREWF